MPVETTDLGAAVCRAVMRAMDGKPVALEKPVFGAMSADYELTSAAAGTILRQWCVILLPTLDFISVRAHLKYWGMGLYDYAQLSPEAEAPFRHCIFVRYPQDRNAITGPEYEAELRAAVEKAATAVEEDWNRARSASRAGRE